MPELPEVETIVRGLRRSLTGRRIQDVWLSGRPLRRPVARDFADRLRGRIIRRVRRRGKYVVFEVDPKGFWLVHLGMSGRLCRMPQAGPPGKHTHAVIRFSDGSELHYRDPRRFGLMALYDVARPDLVPELRAFGPDPLGRRFDAQRLWNMLRGTRREIKAFLLDQRRIAGIGNIYACEALFRARVHPARRCDTLSRAEARRLASALRRVLREALAHRGTSLSDFVDSAGRPGDHGSYLRVYGREGESCRRCRAAIARMIQGNRSSFFCPRCQR